MDIVTSRKMSDENFDKMMKEVKSMFHSFPKSLPSTEDTESANGARYFDINEAPEVLIKNESGKSIRLDLVQEVIIQNGQNKNKAVIILQEIEWGKNTHKTKQII